MALRNASDRDVESDLTIRMRENATVSEGDTDWRTRFGGYLEEGYDICMDKI